MDKDKKYRLPSSEELAKPQTFDPNVFISSDVEEQKVCSLVLSLSLIHNDLKDLTYALELVRNSERDEDLTANNGQRGGMILHIQKLFFSLYHELFKLVEKNLKIFEHPLMVKTINSMPKAARESMKEIIDISKNKTIKNDLLNKVFYFIRNKITYHMDLKEIKAGFEKIFYKDNGEITMLAYISRGKNMASSRFYFADATVEGYLSKEIGKKVEDFYKEVNEQFDKVNSALYFVVERFVFARGFCWKDT